MKQSSRYPRKSDRAMKDNAEAVQKAMELAAGKIELESIFKRFEGSDIEKIYD